MIQIFHFGHKFGFFTCLNFIDKCSFTMKFNLLKLTIKVILTINFILSTLIFTSSIIIFIYPILDNINFFILFILSFKF